MTRRPGFTLIELLAVLAVMAILFAVTVPFIGSILSALAISSATNQVFSTLTLARQDAITRNQPVAVYFFQYPTDSLPAAYRAVQIWELGLSPQSTSDNPVLVPTTSISRFTPLGGRVILATGLDRSADVLNPAQNTAGAPGVVPVPPKPFALGSAPLNGNYMAIVFRPNGSTSLPLTATDSGGGTGNANSTYYWSLTVCDSVAYQKNPGVLPPNSATIQIDAISGTCQILRP